MIKLKITVFFRRILSGLFLVPPLFLMCDTYAQAVDTSRLHPDIAYWQTEDGVRFGLWGGKQGTEVPVMFILSATIEESLGEAYFRQCGDYYGKEGWMCVSIDLPFHGKLRESGRPVALEGWADAAAKGEDFVTLNNQRMRSVLDYLIKQRWIDTANIIACGTSRGGYLALQYAAADPRVNAVAAFSPVTNLLKLREFEGLDPQRLLPVMKLSNHIAELAQKDIWMVIGDQDTRVDTHAALAFMGDLLTEKVRQASKAKMEINVMHEPKGHTTPQGSVERSVAWISQIIR